MSEKILILKDQNLLVMKQLIEFVNKINNKKNKM